MTTAALVTADELLLMKDDGYRYELVRGEEPAWSWSSIRRTRR